MNFAMAMAFPRELEGVSFEGYAIVLLSLTTSTNIAKLLGLRWKRVNLSTEPIMLGDRILEGKSLAVRENFYRGVFGTVKKKSRNRDLPLPKVVLHSDLTRRRQTLDAMGDRLVGHAPESIPVDRAGANLTLATGKQWLQVIDSIGRGGAI
jgi:hypothetical protein